MSEPGAGEQVRLCTFVVGNLLLGLSVEHVSEVVRGEQLTAVPLAPPGVVGLLNLRGHIIPAVDARTRFGMEASEEDEPTHVIVNRLGEQISLVVDRVSEVVTVSVAEREDVPDTVSPGIRRLLTSSYQREGALLLVIDPHLVLTDF